MVARQQRQCVDSLMRKFQSRADGSVDSATVSYDDETSGHTGGESEEQMENEEDFRSSSNQHTRRRPELVAMNFAVGFGTS